jgi:N6-adenosine-specific RNA methylase IME4
MGQGGAGERLMPRKFHPVANIFPLMVGKPFERLVESIRVHGLLNPIWLHPDGSIIDGRNRYRACLEAGVEPWYREWDGKGSLVAFVVAQNIERRHLTKTQKALLGKALMPLLATEAKKRQQEAGRQQGHRGKEGGRGKKKPLSQKVDKGVSQANANRAMEQAAKIADTSRTYIAMVTKIEREAPEVYAQIESGELEIPEAKQEIKKRKKEAVVEKIKREPLADQEGQFRVQIIDPPWQYRLRAEDPTHRSCTPYPTMTLDAIKALPIKEKANRDGCILWLWTTNAFMRQAFECLDAWGFENKTILTWGKDRMGTGDWLRGQTEHCLMAIRGKPIRQLTNQTTLLLGPLREHSRKPDEFYSMVKSLCPGNIGEWFAREEREGITPIMSGELGKFSGDMARASAAAGATVN